MTTPPGFARSIIRLYLLGAGLLMGFYLFAFHAGVLVTENTVIERRLDAVAPFHLAKYTSGATGIVTIDPLLTLYSDFALLPTKLSSQLSKDWIGNKQIMLANEEEYRIFAQDIQIDGQPRVVYAVEDSNSVEWDDYGFLMIEISLGGVGIILFLLTALYMVKSANKISMPFASLAKKLEINPLANFEQLQPEGQNSNELHQILHAINAYRARLCVLIRREKSFTRYVSHELRTPMMLIKAAISNIKQQDVTRFQKPIEKIEKATNQMDALVQTFLHLARDEGVHEHATTIDDVFLNSLEDELSPMIETNHIVFSSQVDSVVELRCNPLLIKSIFINLLKNAFASAVNGNVSLHINQNKIKVIDDGVGLDANPRGYEGFGIGLELVKDICQKYDWTFRIENNQGPGCMAVVIFDRE
ncbi:MAG: HAMP domain-containing sensor histidine kinase [Pseudomonadota bacterium]